MSAFNVRRIETCLKYASIEMCRKWRELHGAHLRKLIKVNSPLEKCLGKASYIRYNFIIHPRPDDNTKEIFFWRKVMSKLPKNFTFGVSIWISGMQHIH